MDMNESTQINEAMEFEAGKLTPDDLAVMMGGVGLGLAVGVAVEALGRPGGSSQQVGSMGGIRVTLDVNDVNARPAIARALANAFTVVGNASQIVGDLVNVN